MRDVYRGPAVLLDADGAEIPVTANLWLRSDDVQIPNDGLFAEYRPGGPYTWGGIIEASVPLPGRRLPLAGTLRFPDGWEGRIAGMSGDSASPNRVEVEGAGPVPWEVGGE